MQKFILLLLILTSIISGCAPQVTVTPEATATLQPPTALPTPTLHPDFVALQDKMDASGERFTLMPDGTVQDGATTIPGLQVGNDGKIAITVDGEQVEIDPSIVNFDDENGLSVLGVESKDGKWVKSQEIVDIGGNLSVILGEKVEGGTLIDSFVASTELTPEQQAEELKQTDYKRLGFSEDSLVWLRTDDGRVVLVSEEDHGNIVAERKIFEQIGTEQVVIDGRS